MKVLISGGGIAGLTLAQGLRREGVECEVFERERLETWRTGYLLNLDVEGDEALAACLPPALYELFKRASGETMAPCSATSWRRPRAANDRCSRRSAPTSRTCATPRTG
jgi:2-polyprenyl-6-methoxyphenol hydroxylase-like FAD-dependent oxidoreductase